MDNSAKGGWLPGWQEGFSAVEHVADEDAFMNLTTGFPRFFHKAINRKSRRSGVHA
jgi:hypothetical protein